jgi:hypothetical protein
MRDVTRKPSAAPWLVKYAGDCMHCGRRLEAGEPGVYDRQTRRIHCIDCPRPSDAQLELPPERGIAGAAALERYQRLARTRERGIRAKWGDRLGGLILAASSEPQTIRAWKIGANGEEKVGALLDSIPDCRALHDRRLTGHEGNIDHIVVSAAGVFVVDTKNHAGVIRVKARGSLLRPESRLIVGRHDRSDKIVKVLEQAEAVRQALAHAQVTPLPPVTPVACFVAPGMQLFAPSEYRGVRITRPASLHRLIIKAPAADAEDVDGWLRLLAKAFPPMLGDRAR